MKHGHRCSPGMVQSWAWSQLRRRERTPGYTTVQGGEEGVGKRWAGRDAPPHLHGHNGGHPKEAPRHAMATDLVSQNDSWVHVLNEHPSNYGSSPHPHLDALLSCSDFKIKTLASALTHLRGIKKVKPGRFFEYQSALRSQQLSGDKISISSIRPTGTSGFSAHKIRFDIGFFCGSSGPLLKSGYVSAGRT